MHALDDASMLALGRSVVRSDIQALVRAEEGLGDGFTRAVHLLLGIRGKILVAGMGTSGTAARRIAHLLSCGGTPAVFVHAADGLHGGLGAVARDDCVIAVSRGGESDELNEFCRRARALGTLVVAMTAVTTSPLALIADHVLPVITPPESEAGGMLATGSALAACAVGDALAVALMQMRGDTWQRFEASHPGGATGKRIEERG